MINDTELEEFNRTLFVEHLLGRPMHSQYQWFFRGLQETRNSLESSIMRMTHEY